MKNKQRFLVLSQALQKADCMTHNADWDSDLLKVRVAAGIERRLLFLSEMAGFAGPLVPPRWLRAILQTTAKGNMRGACISRLKKTKEQLGLEACRNILASCRDQMQHHTPVPNSC